MVRRRNNGSQGTGSISGSPKLSVKNQFSNEPWHNFVRIFLADAVQY